MLSNCATSKYVEMSVTGKDMGYIQYKCSLSLFKFRSTVFIYLFWLLLYTLLYYKFLSY